MPEPVLISRQRELLRDLIQRAAKRAETEPTIPAALQEQTENIESEFTAGRESVSSRLAREQEENDRQMEQAHARIEARYKAEQENAQREYTIARGKVLEREQEEKEASDTTYREACWTIAAILEGAKNGAEEGLRENKTRLQARLDSLHEIQKKARALLEEWKQPAK
jgi:hypothetical protein